MQYKTRDLVETALLTALVYVFTRILNIQLPISFNGGLIHLGNVMSIIACLCFGKNKGAMSSALGMSIFDILSGYTTWAPFTFIIRYAMCLIFCFISEKNILTKQVPSDILAVLASGIFMIAGYFCAGVLLSGSVTIAFTAIPGDILVVAVGGILGLPISYFLKSSGILKHITKRNGKM